MLLKVIGIGIVGVVMALLFKETKPVFATLVTLATCVIISLIIIAQFSQVYNQVEQYLNKLSLQSNILNTALKVAGVGYLIEFASDIAQESGMQSVAHKIIFAGKVIIACMCLPFVFELFDMVIGLL